MTIDKKQQALISFLGLLSLSIALRLIRLNAGFWLDEIITVSEFSRKGWLEIVTQIPIPNNHVLYTLLAKLSMTIFGEKEWSARLPALVMGALTPAVSYLLFRRRFSEFASFCAGLFMAVNYWAVWFSQDARGYSGLILFGLLGTWFFLEYIDSKKPAQALAYILCAGLAVHFHLYGIFLIAAQFFWGLICLARKKSGTGLLLLIAAATTFALSLYLPASAQLIGFGTGPARDTGLKKVNPELFNELLLMLSGSNHLLVAIIFGLFMLAGFWGMRKTHPGFLFINLLSAAFAICFTLLAGVFIYPRFLFYLFPFSALALTLGVEGLANLPNRKNLKLALTLLLTVMICVSSVPGLNNYYHLGKQGFKDAALFIKSNHPGQQIIGYGTTGKRFTYYFPDAIPVEKETRLYQDFILGRLILSSRTDWQDYNIGAIQRYCRPELYFPSAGPQENVLILLNCPK